jgi:hypothetical protein
MADIPGYADENWKAGATAEGSFSPTQLFTAEDEIKTVSVMFLTGQDLDVGTIVALDAADKAVPWDPAAVDSEAQPVGVVAVHMDTTTVAGDAMGEIWEGGCFNPDLLIWPAALNTFAERNAALRKVAAPFRVKRLL